MATKRWVIVDGPSEMDLFVLGLARNQPVGFISEYSGGRKISFRTRIVRITAKDGFCKEWMVEGFIRQVALTGESGSDAVGENFEFGKFKMFFSYKKGRTGWVEFYHLP